MRIVYAQVPIEDILGFVRRNSQAVEGYGVGPFGWRVRLDMSKKNKPKFRAAMVDSILTDGIRNPLLGYSFKEGLLLAFGAGRLKAAKEAGLTTVPMIVNDFTGEYDDYPEVTEENWTDYFVDVPITYEFSAKGFTYHYNMTKSTRTLDDPAGMAWYEGDENDFSDEFPYLYV
jgi:hypothetical protein